MKHFTSLFEPAIIIFMGLIVGFVAVALVSAMYGDLPPGQGRQTLLPFVSMRMSHFEPPAHPILAAP